MSRFFWPSPRILVHVAIFTLLALLLCLTAWNHELAHDEAQAWNIARAAASPLDLPALSRYEGHTPLWYAVLWPLTRSGEPAAMQALALFLALAALALLLHDRPFGTAGTLLVAAGYYGVYEYAIVARPYTLTLLSCAVLAHLYRGGRRGHPLAGAALCALIALLSAFSLLLSTALIAFVLLRGSDAPGAPGVANASRARPGWLALAATVWAVPALVAAWLIVMPTTVDPFSVDMTSGDRMDTSILPIILRTPVFPHLDRLWSAVEQHTPVS